MNIPLEAGPHRVVGVPSPVDAPAVDLAQLDVPELMLRLAQVEREIRQVPSASITTDDGELNPRFRALVLREAALVAALRGPRGAGR